MNKEQLIKKWGEPQKVGSDGHVRLVDVMGDDAAIVQAARVSYGEGTKTLREDRGLIRYLMRHQHTSPLEMCEIKLHVRVPDYIWKQQLRHRTASINEYSQRYSVAIPEKETTAPEGWRLQSKDNKQGSSGLLVDLANEELTTLEHSTQLTMFEDGIESNAYQLAKQLSEEEAAFHTEADRIYQRRLDIGIAREQARKDLPRSNYTEAYWKVDLHNLLHFLALRLDSHAQLEIREFGEAIANIVRDWVPLAWEAFEDYRIGGVTLSRQELEVVRSLVKNAELPPEYGRISTFAETDRDTRIRFLEDCGLTNKRERLEFWNKVVT